eukprot:scaffold120342_cov57-Phaeocystis_antarctica.AAC.3
MRRSSTAGVRSVALRKHHGGAGEAGAPSALSSACSSLAHADGWLTPKLIVRDKMRQPKVTMRAWAQRSLLRREAAQPSTALTKRRPMLSP